MSEFKQVEPLSFENRRAVSIESLDDGAQYVDLSSESEKQYLYFMYDEAMALRDWLNKAIGDAK